MNKRHLTKSRFLLAMQCPTKLFYTGKTAYADQKLEDSFLMELANGGYQVGELAKCYFPNGHDIFTLDKSTALTETNELLKLDNVTIYEAAIASENLLIRADILVKKGNVITLYEVKAKSFDQDKDSFLIKNGTIKPKWKPYLYDVAFQKHVINQAYPQYEIVPHLMLVDKTATGSTEGLNQKFQITKDSDGRKFIPKPENISEMDLNPPILCAVNVDTECELIYAGKEGAKNDELNFVERVNLFADHYSSDTKIPSPVSVQCADCEFQTKENDKQADLKSGRNECWKEYLGWDEDELECPTVLDVWNFRRRSKLIEAGCIKMSDLNEEDVEPKGDDKPGLSSSQRRWIQVEKYKKGDRSYYIDRKNMELEMNRWVFPLHFIDFETSMVALPFNAGRHPYEGIAFQFSHHTVKEDGTIEHAGEYLNSKPGEFPNYIFLRALKAQLDKDEGSVFRYGIHENSFLNTIYRQLRAEKDPVEDSDELCEFIKTITKSVSKSKEEWVGKRNMVDMCEIVKRFYYDPSTMGSNSIKQVLPSILEQSTFLQEKYSKPIYGSSFLRSLNFENHRWVQFENEKITDPYKDLPKMFQDVSERDMEILLSDADELQDGGAAMSAYAKLQFEKMSDYERDEIRKALLQYCELDTMAMVMIYEGWRDLLKH